MSLPPPPLTERDYATTLQMRQSALAGQSTPLLRGDPAAAAAGAALVAAVPACSCPLHGHLAAAADQDDDLPPPPPSPHRAASPPQRFSSFRPRVEHIYEVPKFVDSGGGGVGGGAGGDVDLEGLDDGAPAFNFSSPLYSELDTSAFGTVGRRTPSIRRSSSRRQPLSSLR